MRDALDAIKIKANMPPTAGSPTRFTHLFKQPRISQGFF